jgi:hypothetical protein
MARRKARTARGELAKVAKGEEFFIETNILLWRPEYEVLITAEASNEDFRRDFLHRLQTGTGALDAAGIVHFAENGHPPAAAALDDFIHLAMEESRFDDLPLSVRSYAHKVWSHRHPLPPLRYPSTAPQIINNFKRDLLITRLIDSICERWPSVPRLYPTKGRRSAAALVGGCLEISESQVRKIYLARRDFAATFTRFMDTYRLLSSP